MKLLIQIMVATAAAAIHAQTPDFSFQAPFSKKDSTHYAFLLSSLYDEDGDGIPESITTHTYDASGNQLTTQWDDDGDGSPNTIYTYTYDANGNRISKSEDNNVDGIPDAITTYTYDSASWGCGTFAILPAHVQHSLTHKPHNYGKRNLCGRVYHTGP